MPTSAVYQPTTVTYEQQPTDQRWNCPMSYFSRRVTSSFNRTICLRIGFYVLGIVMFIIGVALTIDGLIEFEAAPKPVAGTEHGVGKMIAGSVLMTIGILVGVIVYCAWIGKYGINGKEAPASGAAALTALNPSTDPLVAAQYAPVRDAPPAPDDEMRNLMDNKDCVLRFTLQPTISRDVKVSEEKI